MEFSPAEFFKSRYFLQRVMTGVGWILLGIFVLLQSLKAGEKSAETASPVAAGESPADLRSFFGEKDTVDLPPGEYTWSDSLELPSHIKMIRGKNSKIIFQAENESVFIISGRDTPLLIQGLAFEGPATSRVLEVSNSENLTIQDCRVAGLSLIRTGKDRKPCRNIRIQNTFCSGTGKGEAIELRYAKQVNVTGNVVTGYRHGIMWWGGDSAKVPKETLPDYGAGNIRIYNNIVKNVRGAAIWGSMGSDIVVAGNVVDGAGDVGIDLEGCAEAKVFRNTVFDAKNGGLSIFFFSADVQFLENIVISRQAKFPVFRSYNKSQRAAAHPSISLIGNYFHCLDGVARFDDKNGPMKGAGIYGNTFRNVRIDLSSNNASAPIVVGNLMKFTVPIPDDLPALKIRSYNGEGWIRNNRIQGAGDVGTGILLLDSDFNKKNNYFVYGNIVDGFKEDLILRAEGGNEKIFPSFHVEGNIFSSGVVVQTGEQKHQDLIRNNRDGADRPLKQVFDGLWNPSGG